MAMVLVTATATAVGGIGAAIALRTGSASIVQGLFPLVLVVLFLSSAFFPQELMIEPAKTIAQYNPLSFIVEGIREPIISGIDASDTLGGGAGDPRHRRRRPGAQRPGPATPVEGGLMEASVGGGPARSRPGARTWRRSRR